MVSHGLFSAQRFEGRRALLVHDTPVTRALAARLRDVGADAVIAGIDCPAFDAGDPDAVAAAFDGLIVDRGDIDILVHGPAGPELIGDGLVDEARWRAVLTPAYDGFFFCAAEFVRRRLPLGTSGAILALAPARGFDQSGAQDVAASTAAAALTHLVKTLSVEWARDGIRVNALASTAFEPKGDSDTLLSLADTGLYLCSPFAAYVTGSVIVA